MENKGNKIFNTNEVDFLTRISKILLDKKAPDIIVKQLDEVFSLFFSSSELTISVWDETAGKLRDFAKEWISYSDNTYNDNLYRIYKQLKNHRGKFFFNDTFVD